MKSWLFFFTILTLLCLPSCKKDDNNGNGNSKLLDFVTYTLYPDTVYYGYNSDKQINRVEDHTYDFTFDLDGDGFPIRSILMDTGAPAPDTTTYHYQ